MAYTSDESGDFQIYVRPIPGPGPRYPVSDGRGLSPAWARDGRTLYYIGQDRGVYELVAAAIRTTPEFGVVSRTPIYRGPMLATPIATPYDVSPDGRRLLFMQPVGTDTLMVVHNWAAELRARLAAAAAR